MVEAIHILQAATLAGIGWTLKKVISTNGSVGKLNEWKTNHEKLDDERHEQTIDSLKDINSSVKQAAASATTAALTAARLLADKQEKH